jgi:hypothetical protein
MKHIKNFEDCGSTMNGVSNTCFYNTLLYLLQICGLANNYIVWKQEQGNKSFLDWCRSIAPGLPKGEFVCTEKHRGALKALAYELKIRIKIYSTVTVDNKIYTTGYDLIDSGLSNTRQIQIINLDKIHFVAPTDDIDCLPDVNEETKQIVVVCVSSLHVHYKPEAKSSISLEEERNLETALKESARLQEEIARLQQEKIDLESALKESARLQEERDFKFAFELNARLQQEERNLESALNASLKSEKERKLNNALDESARLQQESARLQQESARLQQESARMQLESARLQEEIARLNLD